MSAPIRILNLETSSEVCSVCLTVNGKIISIREQTHGMAHAEKLGIFIQEVLKEGNLAVDELQAVAVSAGPGSYTGLRIGTALAKGLCYPNNIPLIGIDSLMILAEKFITEHGNKLDEEGLLCPMIDARRLEVFTAVYSLEGETILTSSAMEITNEFLSEIRNNRPIYFIGNGAKKTSEIISQGYSEFYPDFLSSSSGMAMLSYQKFISRDFENLAYFEPSYLKEAFITQAKS
ncbi:MAG: tRNA (adenosine(37)-N6)-threonylcarbamoyltransferase complex dimerization subunit type 1 TsaB [Bacteroidia bacterium]|nr:tRNA (adenosine(37)-N6)-threonylcarbamoyltransferase complex dimerization subunit type 1 TsaB [Bacteroidia bacterium]